MAAANKEFLTVFKPGGNVRAFLPLETVTQTIVDVGKKGAGKSYLLGVLEEEFAKRQIPFTVIDPVGAHWGIKQKYKVIVFGGSQPDVPLDPAIGADVAEITVKSGMSNILDIHDFSKAGQRKFVADFTERIMQINETPRHIILEEADLFLPQRISGDTARVYNEVDNMVRRGRQRGLGVSVASQRPALLNKDTTSQADLYLFFRMPGTQDRDAVKDLLTGLVEPAQLKFLYGELPRLGTGWCLMYSPEWLDVFGDKVHVRERETFHAGRTPVFGEKLGFKPVPVDTSDLAKQLEELVSNTATEQNELAQAKSQIHELASEIDNLNERLKIRDEVKDFLKQTNPPGAKGPLVLTGDRAVELETKYAAQIASLHTELDTTRQQLGESRKELAELQPYIQLKFALDGIYNKSQQNHTIPVVDPAKPEWAAVWMGKLPEAPKKILQFLLAHPGQVFTAVQLAQLTGYQHGGGSWNRAIATLRRNKLVRDSKEGVRLA